jgi:transcriptional regulator with XRE-family HTH domain/biotin operon repressor
VRSCRDRILDLLSTEEYTPIAEIASAIDESENYVRKAIRHLRRDGHAIENAYGLGYRRVRAGEAPSVERRRGPRGGEETFGGYLYRRRVEAGLSQAALARRAGLASSHISHCEIGSYLPRRPMIEKLADGLDLGVVERDRLMVLAGLCPSSLLKLNATRLGALLTLANVEAAA